MILVDSSVWVDYFRGRLSTQTEKLDSVFSTNQFVVGDLILAEVLQGFEDERQFSEVFSLFQTVQIVQLGGYFVAVEAAKNCHKLRRKGFTIRKTIDTFIATACIYYGYELLHNDQDFLPFEQHLGLKCAI